MFGLKHQRRSNFQTVSMDARCPDKDTSMTHAIDDGFCDARIGCRISRWVVYVDAPIKPGSTHGTNAVVLLRQPVQGIADIKAHIMYMGWGIDALEFIKHGKSHCG